MITSQDRESGSSLILIIFAGFISLALILGVASASSLYLERKRLLSLADAVSLAAAESFNIASSKFAGGKVQINLSSAQVAQAATSYLTTARSQAAGVRIAAASSPDGKTAQVKLITNWKPPFVTIFFPQGFDILVTSTSRTAFN